MDTDSQIKELENQANKISKEIQGLHQRLDNRANEIQATSLLNQIDKPMPIRKNMGSPMNQI